MDDHELKDIARSLPKVVEKIYDDGLSEMTSEFGHIGTDLVKALRLVLFPLQYGALAQDKLNRYLKEAVKDIPEKDRVVPRPEILNKAIDDLKYQEDGPISEAYIKLLKSAFNKETTGRVHPAFIHILRQLAPDEIIIIYEVYKYIKTSTGYVEDTFILASISNWKSNIRKIPFDHGILDLLSCEESVAANLERYSGYDVYDYWKEKTYNKSRQFEIISKRLLNIDLIAEPSNIHVYLEHLEKIGIIQPLVTSSSYPNLFKFQYKNSDKHEHPLVIQILALTQFGSLFAQTCIPDEVLY